MFMLRLGGFLVALVSWFSPPSGQRLARWIIIKVLKKELREDYLIREQLLIARNRIRGI